MMSFFMISSQADFLPAIVAVVMPIRHRRQHAKTRSPGQQAVRGRNGYASVRSDSAVAQASVHSK
jgi:hypothetical protein